MPHRAIVGARVFTPEPMSGPSTVLIEGDRIASIGPQDEVSIPANAERIPADHQLLIPGLIDLHTHGLLGSDVMGTGLADAIVDYPRHGVTSFLATTVTRSAEATLLALTEMGEIIASPPRGARCLGIHLEGPYLAAEHAGMADPLETRDFDWAEFEVFQAASGGQIRCLTVAPERLAQEGDLARVADSGVLVSIGHTGASLETAQSAFSTGASRTTHLFNAMTSIHHRSPGAAIAALLDPHVYAEVIADGTHVAPSFLELAYRLKGLDRMILVSDSAPQAGLPDGGYMWGDLKIQVRDHRCQRTNGTLAGSWYGLDRSLRILVEECGLPVAAAVHMSTRTPSESLHLHDRGRLLPGSKADLCLLTPRLEPIHTIVGGESVWQASPTAP